MGEPIQETTIFLRPSGSPGLLIGPWPVGPFSTISTIRTYFSGHFHLAAVLPEIIRKERRRDRFFHVALWWRSMTS
jgi:hypothetical protein